MLETEDSRAGRYNSKGRRATVFRGPLPRQQRLLWRGGHAGALPWDRLLRADELEADIAFELVGRLLAGMRIVLALPRLA